MRLCSILLLVLSFVFCNNISYLSGTLQKNEPKIINISSQNNTDKSEFNYQNKVPQSLPINSDGPVVSFFIGIKSALFENVKNILRSFLYPVESVIRVIKFCYKISASFINFVIYPVPDHVYISSIEFTVNKVCKFFNKMSLAEKSKWFGYVITDLMLGYFAPAGLGWKAMSLTKNAIMSVKGIKYIDNLNRITKFNLNILRVIDNSSSITLLNVKYGFEYADQFKQYFNDVFRHEGY